MNTRELMEKRLGGFTVHRLDLNDQLDEALKLNPPGQRRITDPEMQAMAGRIKSKTKTPKERMGAYIHASNITKTDDAEDVWDLDQLRQKITKRPLTLMGINTKMVKSAPNAKMVKSSDKDKVLYDISLPALKGIVVDEETGEFVEITTCPSAGECQKYCYARRGGYVMFPTSSLSAARALNFLVNDPAGYFGLISTEINKIKKKLKKKDIELVVRWHDAGDFFSKEYLEMALDLAKANPDVQFYAYTKVADIAVGNLPSNFLINFSTGAKRSDVIQIQRAKDAGKTVKQAITVPQSMFWDLIQHEGNALIKDAKGRIQFKDAKSLNTFRQQLAKTYHVPVQDIITYDQMLDTPQSDQPRWHVIVTQGDGDRAAFRPDVITSFLLWHR